MKAIDLTRNFKQIFESIEATGNKRTTVAKFMGYTTTAQLNGVLDGTSMLSTKAIIALIENLNVNPLFLFLGKGQMTFDEPNEDDLSRLKRENEKLLFDYNESLKAIASQQQRIQELEKSNADLLEMSSAALKYYKSKYDEDSKNLLDK